MTETKAIEYGEKSRKSILIPTYLAAVACLLAGLLVPLFRTDTEFFSDRMMIKFIPQMINTLLSFTGKNVIPDSNFFISSAEFERIFSISIIKTFCSATVLLYTLMCVVSIIMIIPICLSDSKKRTGFRCAVSVEIITLILVAIHIAFNCYWMVSFGISQGINILLTDINMIIPLFGVLFAASFQSIAKNGYIGVSKTIGVVLSFFTAMTFFSFSLFIPGIDGALGKLSSFLGAGKKAGFVTGIDAFNTGYGVDGLSVMYGLNGASVSDSGQPLQVVIYILVVIIFFMVTADVIFDIIDVGIGRKVKATKNKAFICKNSVTNNFAVGRYFLTLAVAVFLFIFCFATEGVMPGVYMYFLLIFLFLQAVNALIRTTADNDRFKKAKANGIIDEDGVIIGSVVDDTDENNDLDDPSDEPLVLLEPGFEENADEEDEPEEVEYVQEEMDLPESVYDAENGLIAPPEENSPFVQGNIFDLEEQTDDGSEELPETESDGLEPEDADNQPEDQSLLEEELESEEEIEPEFEDEPETEVEGKPEPEDEFAPKFIDEPDIEEEPEPLHEAPRPQPAPVQEIEEPEPVEETEPFAEEKPEIQAAKPVQAPHENRTVPEPIQAAPSNRTAPEADGVDCDTFINSLSEDERDEFIEVFVNKSAGSVAGVPDYKPGRDNSAFFAAVFRHIAKYRKLCSDRLLVKIYKQLNR